MRTNLENSSSLAFSVSTSAGSPFQASNDPSKLITATSKIRLITRFVVKHSDIEDTRSIYQQHGLPRFVCSVGCYTLPVGIRNDTYRSSLLWNFSHHVSWDNCRLFKYFDFHLTYWGRDNLAAVLQMVFWNTFSFDWNLFLGVQLTIPALV